MNKKTNAAFWNAAPRSLHLKDNYEFIFSYSHSKLAFLQNKLA